MFLEYVVDEELTGYGTLSAIQRGYRADAGICLETSDLQVQPACIGRLWFKLTVRGHAGRLTSDGGVLMLAEIERHLGIAALLARCIEDPRAPERIEHGLAGMIRFRALLIAAGYRGLSLPALGRRERD